MIRVVKLGGSLLELADLPRRLNAWLESQAPARNVVLVGGGAVVDALRSLHRVAPIDDETAHWLCIRAMLLTAEWTAARLGWPIVDRWDELLKNCTGGASEDTGGRGARLATTTPWLFDVESWLRTIEPTQPGARLPVGWHVTSDSIAARLAQTLRADELVLLKSRSGITGESWASAAAEGLVDAWFPTAVNDMEARLVNLRDTRSTIGKP